MIRVIYNPGHKQSDNPDYVQRLIKKQIRRLAARDARKST